MVSLSLKLHKLKQLCKTSFSMYVGIPSNIRQRGITSWTVIAVLFPESQKRLVKPLERDLFTTLMPLVVELGERALFTLQGVQCMDKVFRGKSDDSRNLLSKPLIQFQQSTRLFGGANRLFECRIVLGNARLLGQQSLFLCQLRAARSRLISALLICGQCLTTQIQRLCLVGSQCQLLGNSTIKVADK
ncbi:hypothetical protein C2U29_20285 [Aeromonas veronii]|nr:hypothetical protein C2U29_20285 [Aeromonas veronii]